MIAAQDPFDATTELEVGGERLLFRPIRAGDETELLAFFRDRLSARSRYFFGPHDPSKPGRCMAEFAMRIRRHAERRDLILVGERKGEIVGYFFLWDLQPIPERPTSLGMGLADSLHGRQIGSAMLDCLLERAHTLGVTEIVLTHEASNVSASRLYLSRGFVYTGVEDPRFDNSGVERWMRLELK